jgi:S1-C subfamily serine protease
MLEEQDEFPAPESNRTIRFLQILQTRSRRTWPIAVAIFAAIFSVIFYNILFPAPLPLTHSEIDQIVGDAIASATPPSAYSAQVYQVILPSLVLIQTQKENQDKDGQLSVGSGVVINDNGDILTALHVVSDSTEIEVSFADGSRVNAIISATEPENDIAVLHPIQPPELIVPAILGNPNAMRVGDEAFAVGNPLGLTGSMSAGVISGFDRSIPIDNNSQRLEGLIQFDAAVNPGNSGGPLLNRNGQVVGIVTALANPSKQDSLTGIGFAVPITTAGGAAGLPAY